MAVDKTPRWLELMLLNQAPTDEAQWLQFVDDCPDEGLQLEFKSGRELEKTDASEALEKYVAGFANCEGGILVFGYDERTRSFDGCAIPGGSAVQWVSRVLQSRVGPYLSVQPRVVQGVVRGQPVFAVAVARTAGLVPVARHGRLVVFLRIGDSTIRRPEYSTIGAPEYLMGDLMLGRRAIPDLRLVVRRATFSWDAALHKTQGNVTRLSLDVAAVNAGLLFADSVRFGMIAWTTCNSTQDAAGLEVPDRLLMAIDARSCPSGAAEQWRLRYFPDTGGKAQNLGPFECTESPRGLANLSVPWVPQHEVGRFRAALYVLSRNTEPKWHQLELRYDTAVPCAPAIPSRDVSDKCVLEVAVPRPEVSWGRAPAFG